MATATIPEYGQINFDPMDYDANCCDLFAVAVCDPDTDLVEREEHYTDEDDYRSALRDTYGREVMDEQVTDGWAYAYLDGEQYEVSATYHVAYVIDKED